MTAVSPLAKIAAMVDAHPARHIVWQNGTVPIGYYYLVALTYARWYLKLAAGDDVAKFLARPAGHDSEHNALAYYRGIFVHAGIDIDTPGVPALRALFTLVGGDGGPESSGNPEAGKDPGANNTSAPTVEAGAWQTSANARAGNPALFDALTALYTKFPESGFLSYAKAGFGADPETRNYGTGPGVAFQMLSKECPAYACVIAALTFCCLRTHYGTLRDYKAHVEKPFYAMLQAVEAIVDTDRAAFATALSEDPAHPIAVAGATRAPAPVASAAPANLSAILAQLGAWLDRIIERQQGYYDMDQTATTAPAAITAPTAIDFLRSAMRVLFKILHPVAKLAVTADPRLAPFAVALPMADQIIEGMLQVDDQGNPLPGSRASSTDPAAQFADAFKTFAQAHGVTLP